MTAESLIHKYQLEKHPEGGYFKETYRSSERITANALPARFTGDRSFSTAILFLLKGKEFSALHRIQSDETWHFYAGDPIEVIMIDPLGNLDKVILGNKEELLFQFTVPAGYWFASRCTNENGFSFTGCTVAPGFDFADFELAKSKQLTELFPQHEEMIHELCRQ